MNLNDLGRAAYEAANAAQAQFYSRHAWVAWELLDSNDKRANGLSALAAVERFAEEAARELCEEADGYEADLTEDGLGRKAIRDLEQLRMAAIAAAEKLGELVSSLRDEANTIAAKQQKGS